MEKVEMTSVRSLLIRVPVVHRQVHSALSSPLVTEPVQKGISRHITPVDTVSIHNYNVKYHRNMSITNSKARQTVCGSATQTQSGPVSTGDYVEIQYDERVNSSENKSMAGEMATKGGTVSFVVGASKVIQALEKGVEGMHVGESKVIHASANEAYGPWREEMTAEVKKESAPDLKEGAMVQLSNGMTAVVSKIDDSIVTIDANHPLAGKEMVYDVELLNRVPQSSIETAYFGGGCFWGVELRFQRLPGVLSTEVGYCNGNVEKVTYEEVCSGGTGHAEVVKVDYDSESLSFEDLATAFFENHDPTTLNRQGNDVGTQYRSGIYCTTEEQMQAAEKIIERMQDKFSGQVVTEVEMVKLYNPAEEYHQQYLEKGGRFGRPQSAAKGCTDPVRCYG